MPNEILGIIPPQSNGRSRRTVEATKFPWWGHSVPHCLTAWVKLVTPTWPFEILGEEIREVDEVSSDFEFCNVIDVTIMSGD